jgi:YHS domain-containing protein
MKLSVTFLMFCAFIARSNAQSAQVRQQQFNLKKGLAIEGYDPVAYFLGKAQEGNEKNSFQYKGVIYHFASPSNSNTFKSNPEKYKPVYGGWCAYAMGLAGEKVKADPETFKMIDNKVYLHYNSWGNNTLDSWNKYEKSLKAKAETNWKKLIP